MKQVIWQLLLVSCIGTFTNSLEAVVQDDEEETPGVAIEHQVGQPVPKLTIEKWVNCDPINMDQNYGRVIVLIYWGSYLKEFHEFIPPVIEVADKFYDQGVRFIWISSEPEAQLKANVEALKIVSPVALDKGITTLKRLGISEIPTAVIVDPKGIISWTNKPYEGFGFSEAISKELENHKVIVEQRKQLDTSTILIQEKKYGEALKTLNKLIQEKKTEPILLTMAKDSLAELMKIGKIALELAQNKAANGFYLTGVNELDELAKTYAGSEVAKEAQAASKKLKADKQYTQEKDAMRLVDNAKNLAARNKKVLARNTLNNVIEKYPNTEAAQVAQELLKEYSEG